MQAINAKTQLTSPKLVTGAVSTGQPVDSLAIAPRGARVHAFQAVKTGSAGAFSVTILGSLDGVHFDATPVATLSVSGAVTQVSGLWTYFQPNVATLAAGDAVDVLYAGT